jgi:hypothetical protein
MNGTITIIEIIICHSTNHHFLQLFNLLKLYHHEIFISNLNSFWNWFLFHYSNSIDHLQFLWMQFMQVSRSFSLLFYAIKYLEHSIYLNPFLLNYFLTIIISPLVFKYFLIYYHNLKSWVFNSYFLFLFLLLLLNYYPPNVNINK